MTEVQPGPPTESPTLPPRGWYEDPEGGRSKRYWTGDEWADDLSLDERREAMQSAVADAVRLGWRVESQTEAQAVIVSGHRPNHVLHLILTLVTLGLWLLPWILIQSLAARSGRR